MERSVSPSVDWWEKYGPGNTHLVERLGDLPANGETNGETREYIHQFTFPVGMQYVGKAS